MPALVTRTVGVGRDHTTITDALAWFTTNHPNFVTDDVNGVIEVYNDSATIAENFVIPSYNGDATRDLVITGLGGTFASTRPVIDSAASSMSTGRNGGSFNTVQNLIIQNTSATSLSHAFTHDSGAGTNCEYDNVDFDGGSFSDSRGFQQLESANPVTMRFCLFLNSGSDGFYAAFSCGAVLLQCGSYGNGGAGYNKLSDFDPIIAKNCWSANNTGADWVGSAAGYAGSLNNASEDTSAPGTSPVTSFNPATTFVSAGTDFHLQSGSPLIDAGTDTSGDGITTDPDGVSFTVPYDIGKFAFTSGPTPITFSGPVNNQSHEVNTPFSLDLSTFFSGTETPFTYALQAGVLPTGLTLNTSTGVLSGTPTVVETQAGIVVRGTDQTPDTADTNAFEIDITPTPPANSDFTVTLTNPPIDGTYYVNLFDGTGLIFTGSTTVTSGSFTVNLNVTPGTAVDGLIKNQNIINASEGTYVGGVTV